MLAAGCRCDGCGLPLLLLLPRLLLLLCRYCSAAVPASARPPLRISPARVWPIQALSLLPLALPVPQRAELNEPAERLAAALTRAGLSNTVDTTGTTIGKRYARTDELGVPFAVTVDYDTVAKGTATLRERDSTAQVRAAISLLPAVCVPAPPAACPPAACVRARPRLLSPRWANGGA